MFKDSENPLLAGESHYTIFSNKPPKNDDKKIVASEKLPLLKRLDYQKIDRCDVLCGVFFAAVAIGVSAAVGAIIGLNCFLVFNPVCNKNNLPPLYNITQNGSMTESESFSSESSNFQAECDRQVLLFVVLFGLAFALLGCFGTGIFGAYKLKSAKNKTDKDDQQNHHDHDVEKNKMAKGITL